MTQEESFLRAIVADPCDTALRLVYADWLEERDDPRSEYLRLDARLSAEPQARREMARLRPAMPADWLAFLSDHRSEGAPPDPARIEQAAALLGRPVRHVDEEGYDRRITAAALQGLTGALAWVDCRFKTLGDYTDITFLLNVRDRRGREAAWEPTTYNPFFGCDVKFLEWYGDAALILYQEKHETYACRFGPGLPADCKPIEDDWVLDGRQLAYWALGATSVSRLSVPGLHALPPLTEAQASELGLLPKKEW